MAGPARRPEPDESDFGAVSRAQFARVREDVGARTLRHYASAYLDLLPIRLDRIEQAIAAADPAEATRVMFDLRSSSAMLGARRLCALLTNLESTLRIGLPAGPAQLAVLRAEARAVRCALGRLLDGGSLGVPNGDGPDRPPGPD
jgi:HPt (histidine-containing phosphotransfer) domain-containing protein